MKTIKKIFFSFALLSLFLPIFSAQALTPGGSGWQSNIDKTTNYQKGLPDGGVGGVSNIIQKLLEWFLLIVGVIAVIAFLIAGILYLVSAGDEGKMETAKNAMIAGIIGIIVALCGYIALKAITTWLKGGNTF